MGRSPGKTDALAAIQARAALAVVEYETVAKDKTLKRVKNDALAVAKGFAELVAGDFEAAIGKRDELMAAAARIEAVVEAREAKKLAPGECLPSVPGIHRSVIAALTGDCRKILDARARTAKAKPKKKLRTEDELWDLIERVGRKSGGKLGPSCEAFKDALRELDDASLLTAAKLFAGLMRRAFRWDLWDAATIIHGGCSDDGFWDFRAGLIALGRKRYEAALADPDSLAAIPDVVHRTLFEGFQYCPNQVIAERELVVKPTGHQSKKPAGRACEDEDDLPKRYPRLAKRFA